MENLYSLLEYLNPKFIIQHWSDTCPWCGIVLLLLIIFIETGFFFGFFLPGDSLVFVAGMFVNKYLHISIFLLWPMLVAAAATGSMVGYWFGSRAGNYLANRKENFFYKRRYLDMTRNFYERYGVLAFILGRFMPVVRTFVPIFAGLAKIDYNKFVLFNIIGATIWISTMLFSGFWLGNLFPTLTEHLEAIVFGMIILSTLPVMIAWFKQRRLFRGSKPTE